MEGAKNERGSSGHIRREFVGGMRHLDRFGIGRFGADSSERLEDLYDPRRLLISEVSFSSSPPPQISHTTISDYHGDR